MSVYKCVLFDLDHTLWDYETNSAATLRELFIYHRLNEKGISSFEDLFTTFVEINTHLWDQYDTGKIHKDVIRFERFHKILLALGIDDYDLSLTLSNDYVSESPKKGALMPNAIAILDHLKANYPLYIITNGFEEIQSTKLTSSGIIHYFESVVTSARAGHKKPAKEIFEFTLAENGFSASEAIMVGDNLLTDIAGARNASIATVYFNPNKIVHQEKVDYEIQDLMELKNII
ncbi:MAG: YjjG family noncanonical pyrimidine nucleotidase [Bacteroidia bacterium]|nr:YjjG family noncanonical pyrimidine nucleotidase [Bacteroidia bacterium]